MEEKEKKDKDLTFFQRFNRVKVEINNLEISKSGVNTFSKYKYSQLTDFVPQLLELCEKYNITTTTTFGAEYAVLKLYDCLDETKSLEFSTPVFNIQMKGCNEMQSIGAVQTYARRYLLTMAFDLAIPDEIDGRGDNQPKTYTLEQVRSIVEKNELKYLNADKIFNYFSQANWFYNGKKINDLEKFLIQSNEDKKNKEANK